MAEVGISDLHRQVLTDTKAEICDRIKSEGNLITELESAHVLTPQEAEVVRAEKVSHVRAGCIIDHVRKGTEKGFESFLYVLEQTNHAHLAKYIRDASGKSHSNKKSIHKYLMYQTVSQEFCHCLQQNLTYTFHM